MDSNSSDSKQNRLTIRFGTCLALLLLPGCGEAPPFDLASVHGAVSVDGHPMTSGKLMFAPVAKSGNLNAGKPAFGRIQPDGTFTLTTYKDNDGAVVGEHWVTIFVPEKATTTSDGEPADPRYKRLPVTQKQLVAAGQENEINIQLTSQQVARFAKK